MEFKLKVWKQLPDLFVLRICVQIFAFGRNNWDIVIYSELNFSIKRKSQFLLIIISSNNNTNKSKNIMYERFLLKTKQKNKTQYKYKNEYFCENVQ